MGHNQADGRLDLLGGGAQHRPVHGRRRNRPMHHVIDLVILEAKDFGQPAADFVQAEHRQQRAAASAPVARSRKTRVTVMSNPVEPACGLQLPSSGFSWTTGDRAL